MSKRVEQHWVLEDHLCRSCGGRILRCVKGNGLTPGGNPIFKCADCGRATAAMGPDALCWCGFAHRNQTPYAYMCMPFSILEAQPYLKDAFAACGCSPDRGEVGILLASDYDRLRVDAERRAALAAPPNPPQEKS
jgi:hypothetical protein